MATTFEFEIFPIREQEPYLCFPQDQPSIFPVPIGDWLNINVQYFSSYPFHPSNSDMPSTVFKEKRFSFPCDLFCEMGNHLIQDALSIMDIPSDLVDQVSPHVVSSGIDMVAVRMFNMAVRIFVTNYTPGDLSDSDDSCRQASSSSFINSLEKVTISADDASCCSICLDKFCDRSEVVKTPCSHVFHQDCLLRWLAKQSSCPLCRYQAPC